MTLDPVRPRCHRCGSALSGGWACHACRADLDDAPVVPTLWLEQRLESHGRIWLQAASHEDELRLRHWLRRSRAFELLPEILERLLDELDEHDRGRAA